GCGATLSARTVGSVVVGLQDPAEGAVGAVPAIARLGERVRSEREERLRRDHAVDGCGDAIVRSVEIEVELDQVALVAAEKLVLEPGRPRHERSPSRNGDRGTPWRPPIVSTVCRKPSCLLSGGTTPGAATAGAAVGFRLAVQSSVGLAAAHLRGPRFIMHVL